MQIKYTMTRIWGWSFDSAEVSQTYEGSQVCGLFDKTPPNVQQSPVISGPVAVPPAKPGGSPTPVVPSPRPGATR